MRTARQLINLVEPGRLKDHYPNCLNDIYGGGVKGCPADYPYLKPYLTNESCIGHCNACWDQPLKKGNVYDLLLDAYEFIKAHHTCDNTPCSECAEEAHCKKEKPLTFRYANADAIESLLKGEYQNG